MISKNDIFKINAEKLKRMQRLHVHFALFDIRDRTNYDLKHIPGALFLESVDHLIKQVPNKEMPIVIYDHDDSNAETFATDAINQGYLNIVVLEGGFKNYFL